jgi:hypothetical protein
VSLFCVCVAGMPTEVDEKQCNKSSVLRLVQITRTNCLFVLIFCITLPHRSSASVFSWCIAFCTNLPYQYLVIPYRYSIVALCFQYRYSIPSLCFAQKSIVLNRTMVFCIVYCDQTIDHSELTFGFSYLSLQSNNNSLFYIALPYHLLT